jgi:purine-binding chemotaxis protein CheW
MSSSLAETVPMETTHAQIQHSPIPQEDKQQTVRTTTYGSFWVKGSEFALPVGTIREIVNEPDAITCVPLSPPFLKGLFNIRGMTIPIVDLQQLFELPHSDASESVTEKRKVAIVENDGKCVGILFDKAGEVLNKPDWAGVNLRTASTHSEGGIIDGVLSLEFGSRRVLSIDPAALLGLDRVPHVTIAGKGSTQGGHLGRRRSCVSFELGHSKCAIDLRYVHEVREMPPIDRTWLAGGSTIGSVNLRGTLIPVVDFRSFMGGEPVFSLNDNALNSRKLILIKTESGLVGLMVYAIDSIMPFFEHEVSPFAELAIPSGNVVKGCLFGKSKEVVMLLDHSELISDPELVGLAKICANMQEDPENAVVDTETSGVTERRTFILFSLDGCFAIDTSCVVEVIDKPTTLLQPSFGLHFVKGIINLRDELITLFNLREIYGMGACDIEQQKVLIFNVADQKYAILVDSVDEIATTTSDKILPNYEIEDSAIRSPTSGEVSSILNFVRPDGQKRHAMIMDAAALLARCERMRH